MRLHRWLAPGCAAALAVLAQRVLDAGAGRVEFGGPHGLTDSGGVELLGREVLPLLAMTTR
jgi:5,10-methylenetetrahydromethanopterin reductase